MLPEKLFDAVPHVLPGLLLLRPTTVMDRFGWASIPYDEVALGNLGIHDRFVRDTILYADKRGTVQGLHYQLAPVRQARLLRVLRGSVFVAAVDVRRSSPMFGRSAAGTLTYMEGAQLYVMPGFALGWCSLDPATELLIKSSAAEQPDLQRGINWRDPALKLDWPVRAADALIGVEDVGLPMLADQPDLPA
jgi:dTDP-4-dehydrorhamnose 3,5-epimerase